MHGREKGAQAEVRTFRVIVLALGVIQGLLAGLTALTGGFADGGDLWSRLTLMLVHPVTAAVLLSMVILQPPPRRLLIIGSATILLNVIADVGLMFAILLGAIPGDWWLPLIFAVIPLLGLVYALILLTRRDD